MTTIRIDPDETMELEIPSEFPTLTEAEITEISSKPLTEHESKRDLGADAKAYLEGHNVIGLMNTILVDLFLKRPADPMDHILVTIVKGSSGTQLNDTSDGTNEQLHRLADAAVDYATVFKLPQLFDEMLSAMLTEKPDDHARFVLSWLRWHKHNFCLRHSPEGYQAYLARCEADQKAVNSK